MRNLIIRRSERYDELLINIVTTTEAEFDGEGFKDMILALPLENSVAGILHTINDNRSDRVTNEACHILYGRDYYREQIMGLEFQVSAFFFPDECGGGGAPLHGSSFDDRRYRGKDGFDLYCGTGRSLRRWR